MKLKVSEIFGPTIQGEGMYAGAPAVFLRLAGCNLSCSFGNPATGICESLCDTAYSSIRVEDYSVEDVNHIHEQIMERLEKIPGKRGSLVITGGEPMLQQEALLELVGMFHNEYHITIETNGTIVPMEDWVNYPEIFWSLSPKLNNSCCFTNSPIPTSARQHHRNIHINAEALARIMSLSNNYQLKFVYSDNRDVQEIKELILLISANPYMDVDIIPDIESKILLMPAGATNAQLEKTSIWAVHAAIGNGWAYCDRTHIRIWDGCRGF